MCTLIFYPGKNLIFFSSTFLTIYCYRCSSFCPRIPFSYSISAMTSLRLLWRNSPVKINTLPSFFASQRENVSQRGFNSQPKYKGFFSREIDKSKKENKSENNQSVAATPVSIVDPPPVSTPVVVYNGTMDNTVYSVKHFSLFTSTLILCVQPILLYKSDSVVKVCRASDEIQPQYSANRFCDWHGGETTSLKKWDNSTLQNPSIMPQK